MDTDELYMNEVAKAYKIGPKTYTDMFIRWSGKFVGYVDVGSSTDGSNGITEQVVQQEYDLYYTTL